MDVIYDSLFKDAHHDQTQRQECLTILEETLQSEQKAEKYEGYFSSRADPGSIVEDISEVDAEISLIERQLRGFLIDNKDEISRDILKGSVENNLLDKIRENLEQLWELDDNASHKTTQPSAISLIGEDIDDLSMEDFFENDNDKSHNKTNESDINDEFHTALKRLRHRINGNNEIQSITTGDLATVLDNLSNITDLMELPFLARTCIRTGHYQEAILLYTHTHTLRLKFQDSSIIDGICNGVLKEVSTTMLTGLVKLLATNLTINSTKKILKYLIAIPPFEEQNNTSLLNVFLRMRLKFIENEISSYSLELDSPNDSLIEMIIKRKIEVIREHLYMSLNAFGKTFDIQTTPVLIPLNPRLRLQTSLDDKRVSYNEKEVETNPLMLQFVNDCVNHLLKELKDVPKSQMTNSICLQLVYCSFRLNDLNCNYHHVFLNQIIEHNIFEITEVTNGITKRYELASTYTLN